MSYIINIRPKTCIAYFNLIVNINGSGQIKPSKLQNVFAMQAVVTVYKYYSNEIHIIVYHLILQKVT